VCAALRANGVDAEHPAGGGRKLRDAIQRFKRGENRPSASSAEGTEGGGAFEKDEEDGADGEEKALRRGRPGASEAPPGSAPEARSSDAGPEPPGPGPGRVARSPRALLLPLRRGANGLNLTEAQHVILLEPVLDFGAEAQAMKRVDRIGQTKPTCVHRFLLQGTVEENVQALSNRRKEAARSAAGSARGAAKGITVAEAEMLIPRAGG
jgi:E3 ubiquitin-protein ligase SHPRH